MTKQEQEAYAAAQSLAEDLEAAFNIVATAWDAEKTRSLGWGNTEHVLAAINTEGFDISEAQVWERGPFKDCEPKMQPLQDFFVEPYNSWLLYLYEDLP